MPRGVYKKSQLHKDRIAATLRGRKRGSETLEHRENISHGLRGRIFSPTHRANISKAKKGLSSNIGRFRPTRLERFLASVLDSLGIRYQRQFQLEKNRHPFDFAIVDQRLLIEADGCYWHGCDCLPQSLKQIRARDLALDAYARSLGWTVLRFKECERTIDWSAT